MTSFYKQQVVYDLCQYATAAAVNLSERPSDETWRHSLDPTHADFQHAAIEMMIHSLAQKNRYYTEIEADLLFHSLHHFPDDVRWTLQCAIDVMLDKSTPSAAPPAQNEKQMQIIQTLQTLIRGICDDVLWEIAKTDYGDHAVEHHNALTNVIAAKGGIMGHIAPEHPAEVIRLSSNDPSHAGFAGATAILLLNAIHTLDKTADIRYAWESHRNAYFQLPDPWRSAILTSVRWLYDAGVIKPTLATNVNCAQFADSYAIPTYGEIDSGQKLGRGAILL